MCRSTSTSRVGNSGCLDPMTAGNWTRHQLLRLPSCTAFAVGGMMQLHVSLLMHCSCFFAEPIKDAKAAASAISALEGIVDHGDLL
jgi:hypothetical protein